MFIRYSKPGLRTVRLLLMALPLLTLLFVTTSVSASAHAGPQTWTVIAGMESRDFAIQGNFYAPSDISVHQGDTLHWVVQTHDAHTVTFLAKGQTLPPFNPGDPTQLFPQGGSTYDGLSYFNSGLLTLSSFPGFPPFPTTYDLVMGVTGTFDYYCLLHGVMMHG